MNKTRKNVTLLIVISLTCFGVTQSLLGGVRQMRSANSLNTDRTNIGTNPYKDMEAGYYETVNPNYDNRATAYHQEYGDVAVDPRDAQMTGDYGAVYDGYGAVPATGYYYDYASAPGGPNIPIGTIVEYAPSSAVPIMVGGARYYHDANSGVYFAEVFDGTAVVYQVVEAPLGAVVSTLPAGCIVQNYNGRSFTQCGNTYYKQVAGGYQVVLLN